MRLRKMTGRSHWGLVVRTLKGQIALTVFVSLSPKLSAKFLRTSFHFALAFCIGYGYNGAFSIAHSPSDQCVLSSAKN